jgi:glycosyltransferase involved in cell wall biosynthesis
MVEIGDFRHDTRLLEEVKMLKSLGATVYVIGGSRTPLDSSITGLCPCDWVRIPEPSTSPSRLVRVMRNATNYLGFLRALGRAAAARYADIAWCVNLDGLTAFAIFGSRRSHIVYDAHEVFYEQVAMRPWMRRAWRALEGLVIRRVTLLVTVNPAVQKYFVDRHHALNEDNATVIFSAPAGDPFEPTGVHEPMRVLVQGSFALERGLEKVIAAVASIDRGVHLTLQGYGPLEEELRRWVQGSDLGRKIGFLDPCPPNETALSANAFDVGIVATDPTCLNSELSTPNKLFAYLAGGLALVTPPIPAVKAIVDDSGAGIVLKDFEPPSIADALVHLRDNPDLLREMKERSHELAATFSWGRQTEEFSKTIERVLGL